MKKENDIAKESTKKEIKNTDIPWWIGGRKLTARSKRSRPGSREDW